MAKHAADLSKTPERKWRYEVLQETSYRNPPERAIETKDLVKLTIQLVDQPGGTRICVTGTVTTARHDLGENNSVVKCLLRPFAKANEGTPLYTEATIIARSNGGLAQAIVETTKPF